MGLESEGETPLVGGWVTSEVVRVGQTVRRPLGPNSTLSQRLLHHLEKAGFEASPRFLGIDEQGREILTYIEGDAPSDCRSIIWRDDQLSAVAVLLRRFHDLTAGSVLAAQADVVCHNDFGPWNLIWRTGVPVGIIDFDKAAPGARLDDLGYAVWKHLNLGLIELPPSAQGRRVRLMASAYGFPADRHLLAAIDRAQDRMRQLISSASAGTERDEALSQNRREHDWIVAAGPLLLG